MDLTNAQWHKSSYSGSNGGNCVEVAELPTAVGLRDSKNPDGPALAVEPEAFRALVRGIKSGEFSTL